MSHLIPPAYVTEGLVEVSQAALKLAYLSVYEDLGTVEESELTLTWTSDAQTFYASCWDDPDVRLRAIMELPGTDVRPEVILVADDEGLRAYLVPDDARMI